MLTLLILAGIFGLGFVAAVIYDCLHDWGSDRKVVVIGSLSMAAALGCSIAAMIMWVVATADSTADSTVQQCRNQHLVVHQTDDVIVCTPKGTKIIIGD